MCSEEGVIQIRHVSKMYQVFDRPQDRLMQMLTLGRIRRCREFWAVRDVSLEVFRGECVGIVGTNGSGKSTLLQMVAGTVAPTSGSVTVHGRLSALLELGAGFNPEFTGIENVFLSAAILGVGEAELREKLDSIVGFADIGEFLHQPVKTYSSGMYVRLAFAVAVNVDPDVLIVDEALAVGDNLFQKRCFAKIEELRDRGVTLLFVSHDQESVRTLTNRTLVMDNGRPVFLGASGEAILAYRRLLHEKENLYLAGLVKKASASLDAIPSVPAQSVEVESVPEQAEVPVVVRRFGDRDAEVVEVRILSASGDRCNAFHPLEEICVEMTVDVHRRLNHLNVGFRLRNKQGIKIYSGGTLNQDIAVWSGREKREIFWDRVFEPGTRFTVCFRFTCTLGVGFYEIQSYVSEEPDRYFNQQRILDWADEAAFFTVSAIPTEYFFGGVLDLRMTSSLKECEENAPYEAIVGERISA